MGAANDSFCMGQSEDVLTNLSLNNLKLFLFNIQEHSG
jgi:hypothetical protein